MALPASRAQYTDQWMLVEIAPPGPPGMAPTPAKLHLTGSEERMTLMARHLNEAEAALQKHGPSTQ